MENEAKYQRIVERIHSAIESEQPEPREFNAETEQRLALVDLLLRDALGLPTD